MARAFAMLVLILSLCGAISVTGAPGAEDQEAELERARLLGEQARALTQHRDFQEALPLAREAVTILESIHGPDHPNMARSLIDLADIYEGLGSYVLAEPLLKRALGITEAALEPDHPDVATCLMLLAWLNKKKGANAQAEALYKRSLTMLENKLGPNHYLVAANLVHLALLYQDMDSSIQAEPLLLRAREILKKTGGSNDVLMAPILSTLAEYNRTNGAFGPAERLYKEVLGLLEQSNESDSLALAVNRNNMAAFYAGLGAYDLAKKLYSEALATTEKVLGPEHPEVATILNNQAQVYRDKGSYFEAEAFIKRALAIREKTFGSEHPMVADTLDNLAGVYYAMYAFAKAEPLYKRALAIKEKTLGSHHASQILTLCYLGEINRSWGLYSKAEPFFLEALILAQIDGRPDRLWTVQDGVQALMARTGRPGAAIFFGKMAVNVLQGMRGRQLTLPRELRASFVARYGVVYQGLVDLLNRQGRSAEALEVATLFNGDQTEERAIGGDPRTALLSFDEFEEVQRRIYLRSISCLAAAGLEVIELEKRDPPGLAPETRARREAGEAKLEVARQEFQQTLNEIQMAFARRKLLRMVDFLKQIMQITAGTRPVGAVPPS